ncbi:hypothetical protein CAPN003_18690 [Capnocytophaga stomatis]|nr:hypothetical protein CAPN003_18690 [Capnocytophaga stomatis]
MGEVLEEEAQVVLAVSEAEWAVAEVPAEVGKSTFGIGIVDCSKLPKDIEEVTRTIFNIKPKQIKILAKVNV